MYIVLLGVLLLAQPWGKIERGRLGSTRIPPAKEVSVPISLHFGISTYIVLFLLIYLRYHDGLRSRTHRHLRTEKDPLETLPPR